MSIMGNEELKFRDEIEDCLIGFFVSFIAFFVLLLLFIFAFPQAGQAILLPSFSLFGVQVRDICILDITAIFAFLSMMSAYVTSLIYIAILLNSK